MTVSEGELNVVERSGDGSATSFSFPFTIYESSNLVITKVASSGVETVLTEGTGTTNYSVVVSAYPGSGSITFPASGATRLAVGESIVIQRVLPLEQETELSNQGGYYPKTLETQLDKIVRIAVQQQEEIARSLKGPVTDTVSVEMPSQTDRANNFLSFNGSGVPVATAGTTSGVTVSTFMATVLDDTTAAAARTTLGAAATSALPSAASTSAAGIVELATTAETTTGTDALRAVTPDGLHDMTSLAGAAWFLDEDAMGTNSATKVASQQSVKAYVTSSIAAAAGGFTLATPQATTSGTSIDFTSIPAGTKVIYISFSGVSTNGSSDAIIQIGDSGGVETSGYTGANVDSAQSGGVAMSAGFILDNLQASGSAHYGSVVLTLLNSSTFIWSMTSNIAHGSYVTFSAGGKTLSAELDRVRLTTENGSDTFDAGSVNILYGS
mgnify:FL=1